MITILLSLFILPATTQAAELQYHNRTKHYTLEYNNSALHYRSYQSQHSIKLNKCNKKMIEEFWQNTIKQARKYPRQSKLKTDVKPHILIGKEIRVIFPTINTDLSSMDKEFVLLQVRERKLCSRS